MRVRKVKINYEMALLLIIPYSHVEKKTQQARLMVPDKISITDHVLHAARISTMLYGFMNGDRDAIREGMMDDIVEKSRETLFPYYRKIREKAISENAISVCVSGAGPSILIFTDENTKKDEIISNTGRIMKSYNVDYNIRETSILEDYDD